MERDSWNYSKKEKGILKSEDRTSFTKGRLELWGSSEIFQNLGEVERSRKEASPGCEARSQGAFVHRTEEHKELRPCRLQPDGSGEQGNAVRDEYRAPWTPVEGGQPEGTLSSSENWDHPQDLWDT